MIYIDNSSDYSQRVFIPRDESVDGADITGSTFSLQDKYYVITKNGATVPIHPDAGYNGISGGSITVRVQSTGGTNYFPGEYIDIDENNVISVTGLTEAIQETVTAMTLDYATTAQVQTMITAATDGLATTQYVDNAVSGKADTTAVTQSISNALTAYTPTTGFTTINGSAITEGGNIEIESGGVTTGDVQTMITAATSGLASTQYVDNAVTAATDDMATRTWVNEQGFLTEHQSLSGYSTTQETEAMITAATSGLPTTQYVDNAVSGKADTTAVTQSISDALTAYTPTTGFTTINGSAITEGGDIVIEGGGDASSVEMITELPSDPVDGAVYNYNGVLIKYVNGPGNWGEWFGEENANARPTNAPLASSYLYYGVLPESVNGVLLCTLKYLSTYRYCTINLLGNTIDVYDNSGLTGTPLVQVAKNATAETQIPNSIAYMSWNDNQIQIRKAGEYTSVPKADLISTSINTGHYELVNRPEHSNFPFASNSNVYTSSSEYNPPKNYTVRFDKDGRVVAPGPELTSTGISINNTSTSSYYELTVLKKGVYVPGALFAPITSGDTGSLCVAQGNAAPVWKTIVQALGVDFWTGTQAQYDALESHSPTTLYFIIPQ